MRWRFRRKVKGPRSWRRSFITPEGVDLRLELGSGGARAAAFMLDGIAILVTLIVVTIAIAIMGTAAKGEILTVLWLLGFFFLRNCWFSFFEMGTRGATPGKRLVGLRVVARDGARLSVGAVVARNAIREIEIFLPLSFLGAQAVQGVADGFLTIFALLWSGIFLFFPFFNRDRLRVGDLVAGTWVVRTVKNELAPDLVASKQPTRSFSDAALGLYGIYELQTLEEVLRVGTPEAVATVAAVIRGKAGIPNDGDDYGFLSDYYAALCARLERGLMVGRRRENKFSGDGAQRNAA